MPPPNGSLQHVTGVMLEQLAGIKLVHVPYKGTGQALNDLLGGTVDLTFTTAPPCPGTSKRQADPAGGDRQVAFAKLA